MKECTPDGCKMYVAIKDIDFLTLHEFGDCWLHVQKGDVWMLNQITSEGQVWLDKSWNSVRTLKISQEQLESDFVEVNLNEVNMDTIYSFEDDYCTKGAFMKKKIYLVPSLYEKENLYMYCNFARMNPFEERCLNCDKDNCKHKGKHTIL